MELKIYFEKNCSSKWRLLIDLGQKFVKEMFLLVVTTN